MKIKHKNKPKVESIRILTKYHTHSSVLFPIERKIANKIFIK